MVVFTYQEKHFLLKLPLRALLPNKEWKYKTDRPRNSLVKDQNLIDYSGFLVYEKKVNIPEILFCILASKCRPLTPRHSPTSPLITDQHCQRHLHLDVSQAKLNSFSSNYLPIYTITDENFDIFPMLAFMK